MRYTGWKRNLWLWMMLPWAAAAAEEPLQLWRTPEFQKQFLGTYGMKSDIEPGFTTVEKTQMEQVMAMMGNEAGGPETARAFLEKTVKPASSAVFDFTLGNLYFQKDNPEQAIRWYASAVEKFPAFLRAHKNLGMVYARSGAFDKAAVSLTRAVELGSFDGMTYGLLGYAYLMGEQYASSESAYRQAVMLQPQTVDWKIGLARSLLKQQKYGETVALCDELLRKDAKRVEFWLLQANAFLGLKQTLKAAEIYEYLDAANLAAAPTLNGLADIYLSEGFQDLAAEAYGRALQKEAADEVSRPLRNCEVLAAAGAYAGAEQLLSRVKETFGDRIKGDERKRLLKLNARLAAARGASSEEQVKLLEEIVTLDPLDGDALILLGQQHAGAGALEKAVFYFERAEGIEKYEGDAKLRHGQCLVKNQRYQDALPLLKRANELRPREEVARYIEQVERMARTKN